MVSTALLSVIVGIAAAQGSTLASLSSRKPGATLSTAGRKHLTSRLNTRTLSVTEQRPSATSVKSTLRAPVAAKPLSTNPLRSIGRAARRIGAKAAAFTPVPQERYTSSDWWRNLKSLVLFRSDILKRISGHLIFNILIAVAGATWFHLHPDQFLNLGTLGHTLSGAALSLLLVFRTNSAYDRFWEARKILGAVVDNSRGLSRVAPTALPPAQSTEFGRMIIAFPYCLRLHLTGRGQIPIKETTDAPDVLPYLDEKQVDTVQSYFSQPMAVLSIMNQILNSQNAKFAGEDQEKTLEMIPQRMILQRNVNLLVANTGACERIQGCPVPLSYSRHLSRYLTIWSMTLPLVLAPLLGFWSVPVIGLICWSLFSIEEVGHMIEEPFKALPYDQVQTKRVADVIKRDTLAMYKQQLGVDLETREMQKPAKVDVAFA